MVLVLCVWNVPNSHCSERISKHSIVYKMKVLC